VPWRIRYVTARRAGSYVRRLGIAATHRHCHVEFQGPAHLGPGFSLDIPGPGTFVVGPGVEFRRGFHCEISGAGRVTIGAGSVFTFDALIQCTTSVEIGRQCVFAQSALVVDGSHRFRDHDAPMLGQGYDYQPVRIGDGASIMAKATVLADVGEGAFVAAGAVVTRPVPPFCLAGGVPARVIEYFGPPDRRPPELGATGG
jgi:acetyltransferase-like isoleucine patch superfamily enzyme